MGRRLGAVLVVAGGLLAAEGQARAQAQAPGEIRFSAENDSLLNPFPSRTDRFYTNGLRVELLNPEGKSDRHFLPGITHADWCGLVCGKGSAEGHVNTGYAVGQTMYTPERIAIAAPQPNDRPWAGLLYASRIAQVSYEQGAFQRRDRIEVSIGVVGPASLAGDTQIAFHDLIGAGRPNGWDNQLRNEPILQLRYDTALRWPRKAGGNFDIIPRVRANVGNAVTSLEAEVTGRIGWNLGGFGVSTIGPEAAPASAKSDPSGGARRGKWLSSFNLFVRAGMEAVAHNITLDGNTFVRNDILVRRKPFVPELGAGFEANLVGNFWLSYQFIHRGSDFSRRKLRDAPPQEFGSLTLAWTLRR